MERVSLLTVTTTDPSLIEQLEIQGEASQLFLSTENQREKREQVVKVCFKLASVNDQSTKEITVGNGWAVKNLAVPLKHVSVRMTMGLWPRVRPEGLYSTWRRERGPTWVSRNMICFGWSILGDPAFNLDCDQLPIS